MKTSNINPQEMANKVLITHTDLDGVGCAIIFLKCYPTGKVIFADYHNVDQIVVDLLQNDEDWDILITDISVKPRVASLLDSRGKVGLLDHHETAKETYKNYPWAIIDTTKCGTRLIYNVLSQRFHLADLSDFVDTVEDWDLWGSASNKNGPGSDSTRLNLLREFWGNERFLQRMLVSTNLTQSDKEVGDILDQKCKDYCQETYYMVQFHKTKDGLMGICVAEQYTSLLGNFILNTSPDLEYVMILDPRKNKGSLRGRGNVHLGEMAKLVGGGGHRKAAGFPLGPKAAGMVDILKRSE